VRLITAHRILIGAGIAFFFFYAGWRLKHWAATGVASDLAQAALAVVVALGLLWYVRTLRHWR
jgi:hypothetical protein